MQCTRLLHIFVLLVLPGLACGENPADLWFTEDGVRATG